VEEKQRLTAEIVCRIEESPILPSEANEWLEEHDSAALSQRVRLGSLLLRPELSLEMLRQLSPSVNEAINALPDGLSQEVQQEAETSIKYQRYIEKEQEVANRILKFEDIALPLDYDYFTLSALSYEAREKLSRYRPVSIGQASRISGVSPADISVLLITFAR
jgi:tRNA uridine 5-carboxymethylaminomethyl modification enzyme